MTAPSSPDSTALQDACCGQMRSQLAHRCGQDGCPVALVVRWSDGTYGLPVRDGGSSIVEIACCPWCGTALALRVARQVADLTVDRDDWMDLATKATAEAARYRRQVDAVKALCDGWGHVTDVDHVRADCALCCFVADIRRVLDTEGELR